MNAIAKSRRLDACVSCLPHFTVQGHCSTRDTSASDFGGYFELLQRAHLANKTGFKNDLRWRCDRAFESNINMRKFAASCRWCDQTGKLRKCFGDQHTRNQRLARKVSGKECFISADGPNTFGEIAWFEIR